jgi:diadenosine tetraphosphate (Ap4A) HIT family hydrolase
MDCPFCNIEKKSYFVESEFAFAVNDIHPVSKGHSLVIPKIHIENYFDLPGDCRISCWDLVSDVKDLLQNKYNPDGYNVGMNINRIAGQSVLHAHIHIIPRYESQRHKNFAIENMATKDF